ncbi:hypothetical protein ACFOYW_15170 [Gryllotalpicola reticulitermitis]|uniref:Uncharacterized protein n=1 Tax=Gryllotalpicola reticulitermitis TaxID=1184153 RepID=A0ABV8QA66_9MICO
MTEIFGTLDGGAAGVGAGAAGVSGHANGAFHLNCHSDTYAEAAPLYAVAAVQP